jgi:hypothetical protein
MERSDIRVSFASIRPAARSVLTRSRSARLDARVGCATNGLRRTTDTAGVSGALRGAARFPEGDPPQAVRGVRRLKLRARDRFRAQAGDASGFPFSMT